MARPLSATDDDIINAAYQLVRHAGYDGLTISQLAREVGLTRAAITQRFGSAENLKSIVCRKKAEQLEAAVAELRATPGEEGLIEFAEFLGRMIGSRQNLSSFLQGYHDGIGEDVRLALEERRGQALRQAIARVMPPCAVAPEVAADLFMAFMSGSMLAWQANYSMDAPSFLKMRTQQWIAMMGLSRTANPQLGKVT